MLSHSRLFTSIALATLTITGCGETETQSQLGDIYTNDRETRRDATAEETAWTISLGGCSGSAINAKYILTANHCSPAAGNSYKSGPAVAGRKPADIRVVRVAERSSSLDYSIVEIRWLSGSPTPGQKYSPKISTSADDLVMGTDSVATKLETVGFPIDRQQRVTHAYGFSKNYRNNDLLYNVGSINGNSGGAVWRSSDKMLVSMTNFGSHSYNQPGWNNNNPENPNAWNGGAAMYKVYAQSALLKTLFPGGINTAANENGDLIQPVE
jgi:hypothetical protein